MSWTDFLLVLFGCYVFYYGANLVFDLFLSPRVRMEEELEDELYFSETTSAELVSFSENDVGGVVPSSSSVGNGQSGSSGGGMLSTGILNSSGGVGLKQLFSLAKDNLIEHTGAIPY